MTVPAAARRSPRLHDVDRRAFASSEGKAVGECGRVLSVGLPLASRVVVSGGACTTAAILREMLGLCGSFGWVTKIGRVFCRLHPKLKNWAGNLVAIGVGVVKPIGTRHATMSPLLPDDDQTGTQSHHRLSQPSVPSSAARHERA